jgi:hypothetical protein
LLGGFYKGLVGDGCELAIKVVLMLPVDVGQEVVAKEDADGVVNIAPLAISCE